MLRPPTAKMNGSRGQAVDAFVPPPLHCIGRGAQGFHHLPRQNLRLTGQPPSMQTGRHRGLQRDQRVRLEWLGQAGLVALPCQTEQTVQHPAGRALVRGMG